MIYYTCPVCGYDRLEDPPRDYNICESCGTEFGYHDATYSHAQLRQRWIAAGAPWWDADTAKPPYWNPVEQLRHIGYTVTPDDLVALSAHPAASR